MEDGGSRQLHDEQDSRGGECGPREEERVQDLMQGDGSGAGRWRRWLGVESAAVAGPSVGVGASDAEVVALPGDPGCVEDGLELGLERTALGDKDAPVQVRELGDLENSQRPASLNQSINIFSTGF